MYPEVKKRGENIDKEETTTLAFLVCSLVVGFAVGFILTGSPYQAVGYAFIALGYVIFATIVIDRISPSMIFVGFIFILAGDEISCISGLVYLVILWGIPAILIAGILLLVAIMIIEWWNCPFSSKNIERTRELFPECNLHFPQKK